jgi:hypothetical protein
VLFIIFFLLIANFYQSLGAIYSNAEQLKSKNKTLAFCGATIFASIQAGQMTKERKKEIQKKTSRLEDSQVRIGSHQESVLYLNYMLKKPGWSCQ